MQDRWIVITTINRPTEAIRHISGLTRLGWRAVVIGDTKTPSDWDAEGIEFLSVERQKEVFGGIADIIPFRHYSRKNLGYLYAISNGARLILETDDDNYPYPSFGVGIEPKVRGRLISGTGWVNVYSYFTDEVIWPRGLPLEAIHSRGIVEKGDFEAVCPVQQYLADTDPDVDAIWRLVFKEAVDFRKDERPVLLSRNSWVPFNSQNTVFFSEAFPLLYLPCHVSFRMTDIWRSFVAQASLWVHGLTLSFHPATVMQKRNVHDLMKDFADEVPGYLENKRIGAVLEGASRGIAGNASSIADTARALWMSLIREGIVPEKEAGIIDAWFGEIRNVMPLSQPPLAPDKG
jgi:hypothetical protein